MLANTTFKRASAHVRYSFNVAAMVAMLLCVPLTFAMLDAPRRPEPSSGSLTRPPAPGAAHRPGADVSYAANGFSAVTSNAEPALRLPLRRSNAAHVLSSESRSE